MSETKPAPSSPAIAGIAELIEKHARIAVLEYQHQNDAYEPTPYEANALKNMRHILTRFAADLL